MSIFAHCARAVCGLAIFFSSINLFAADLSFVVRDQSGEPLANAVIELESSAHSSPQSLPVAIMDQVDKQFSPSVLVIQPGQSVDFPNSDNIRHHVYSFKHSKVFDIKLYSDRPEQPERFEDPGVVVLGCNIHDSMVGYIYVANSNKVIKTNADGKVTLTGVTLPTTFTVWHPNQLTPLTKKQSVTLSEQGKDVSINVQEPAPRNTFGEMFKGNND